jgi:hypothetical protein
MPYMTFGPDMQAAGRQMGKAGEEAGKIIVKNIKDPFAMFLPLCEKVSIILWCGIKMLGYVVRKVSNYY